MYQLTSRVTNYLVKNLIQLLVTNSKENDSEFLNDNIIFAKIEKKQSGADRHRN